MRLRSALALLLLTIGCASDARIAPSEALTVRHATRHQHGTPGLQPPTAVRFQMHRHLDDLRAIEVALVDGKLEQATALAYLLARPGSDGGTAGWETGAARVTTAATSLAGASDVREACRREARVTAACARCHASAHVQLELGAKAAPPTSDAVGAGMARYQWAADRLRDGLLASDNDRWRVGLELLADDPATPGLETTHLAQVARRALASHATSLDDRAVQYGEILATCAGCHAQRRSVGERQAKADVRARP